MYSYKITDEELFNEKIIDIDLSGLTPTSQKGSFASGTISLELEERRNDGWINFTGEFGRNDFKDEFGFILT